MRAKFEPKNDHGFFSRQGCDSITWVMQEFSAERPGELSVSKGQQVEVLLDANSSSSALSTLPESSSPSPAMVAVRLSDKTASAGPSEGLVPISCLKLPPGGLQQLRSQRAAEHQDGGKSTKIENIPFRAQRRKKVEKGPSRLDCDIGGLANSHLIWEKARGNGLADTGRKRCLLACTLDGATPQSSPFPLPFPGDI